MLREYNILYFKFSTGKYTVLIPDFKRQLLSKYKIPKNTAHEQ